MAAYAPSNERSCPGSAHGKPPILYPIERPEGGEVQGKSTPLRARMLLSEGFLLETTVSNVRVRRTLRRGVVVYARFHAQNPYTLCPASALIGPFAYRDPGALQFC